jgi:phage/plasmid-associated DNA primase
VEHDPDAENLSTRDAYEIYTAWCEANGEDPIGHQQFTQTLRDAPVNVGYKRRVRPGGTGTPTNGYKALGFTDEVPDPKSVLADDSDESEYAPGENLDSFNDS